MSWKFWLNGCPNTLTPPSHGVGRFWDSGGVSFYPLSAANARPARFWMACADRCGQKSERKGKEVPRDTEEGTSNKSKRSQDSSNEDDDSSDGSSSSDSSYESDSETLGRLLICDKISEISGNWSNARVLCTLRAGRVGGWLAVPPPPPTPGGGGTILGPWGFPNSGCAGLVIHPPPPSPPLMSRSATCGRFRVYGTQ